MESLTSDQRRKLAQLQDLTNSSDDEVAVGILESVEWDVQKAAEMIFGSGSVPNAESSTSAQSRMQMFEVDDSRQGNRNGEVDIEEGSRQPWNPPSRALLYFPGSLLSIFTFPLHILSNFFRFIFGVLRIPIPQFRFSGLSFYRPLRPRPSSSRGGPDRWVRELEEETGAVCISRSRVAGAASGTDAGTSNLTSRTGANVAESSDDGRKLLPDFTLGSYEEALKTCEREAKIGCIVLVSEEHDDVTEFKRLTLTDPTFVKLLYDNDVVVWGGDVRDKEAWSAAEKLQATTYPFVAFLALQPRRGTANAGRSTTAHTLTVLSRHQGRSIPESGPTSAQTLVDHFQRQLIPRVSAFLERIRNAQRERERDRLLREEQDRAFRDSARRDRERIEAKMAQEREQLELKRRQEEQAILEQERQRKVLAESTRRESMRMDWRRWARRTILLPPNESRDGLRIAIRLPGDKRIIQRFPPTASLTSLYVYVDTQLIPADLVSESDPTFPPEGTAVGEEAIERQIVLSERPAELWWGFKLVLAYPRQDISWESNKNLSSIDSLKGGGQVVVEMTGKRKANSDVDDDGYNTDDSVSD